MYWPVGAPKVYALSKSVSRLGNGISHDGLENGAKTVQASSGEQQGQERQVVKDGEEIDANATSGISGQQDFGHNDAQGGDEDGTTGDVDILAAKASRGGGIFASITQSTLTVWQTKPVVALTSVVRSPQSMNAYGSNVALLMRPDALVIVVQTAFGFLITYTLATDPNAHVYQTQLPISARHTRKDSVDGYNSYRRPSATTDAGPGVGDGIAEVSLRFRMVIRIDAGISKALAVDAELVVATQKPAATQCIRWAAEDGSRQTSTELLSRMPWMAGDCIVVEMVHDRPMNLSCWLTDDGKAYAVQRRPAVNVAADDPRSLFRGFCFREPGTKDAAANKVAINARFSLIAIGCASGDIDVYVVKDYMGNIPLSHKLSNFVPAATSGQLTFLGYSPDGYVLFVGYQNGWTMWSVYGKQLATSFAADRLLSNANGEQWLHGVHDAFWIGGGCELAIVGNRDDRLWVMDMARNAAVGCMSSTNVSRSLLCSSNTITLYKGHEVPDLTALPSDRSLWQAVQVPNSYLVNQWPIKATVISPDGNYVAVAGRRGLAHYSVGSGRWKTFEDPQTENELSVRGGMCWHQHFLIACVESADRHQIRIYSREKALERTMYSQDLAAPAILTTTSGSDSLLVYTYDNVLVHYIIAVSEASIKLVQVGQIGFHGIIRAPPRVRAISWILPEDQLEHGNPSQDVATASVIFLVDGKLVLLQPSTNDHGELKYDMRVIAQNVEYYILLRDQLATVASLSLATHATEMQNDTMLEGHLGHSLRDSLWFFDGEGYHVWSDVQDVLACAPSELGRDLPPTVRIPMDFYPVSATIGKGVVHGLDADLIQRRDVDFSFFRQSTRTQLFLPQLLRYHLEEYNSPAALHLANSYQHLPYFAHALEILLHDVLDNEVDHPPDPPETALLPTVLSFLSSFPAYLDIVVNCTRKTELRSWRTLFSYLPPVLQLFEHALAQGKLKTAAGYLLVLYAFEQDAFQVNEFSHLLQRAVAQQDWDLCKELARFLVGIDSTGRTLNTALVESGLRGAPNSSPNLSSPNGRSPNAGRFGSLSLRSGSSGNSSGAQRVNGFASPESGADYFAMR